MNKFCVIVAAYRAEQYLRACLTSIQTQNYKNFEVCVIDDASPDNQRTVMNEFVGEGWHFIYNDVRRGALANQVAGINSICNDDDDIIVFLDGDDKLSHSNVFNQLDHVYGSNSNIELTYGSYRSVPFSLTCSLPKAFPSHVIANRTYRSYVREGNMVVNHLRTLKYRIFKMMDEDVDFKTPDGQWFSTCADTAIMIPGLELAREHRFIPDILLDYTSDNPVSDWRVSPSNIDKTHDYIFNSLLRKVRK